MKPVLRGVPGISGMAESACALPLSRRRSKRAQIYNKSLEDALLLAKGRDVYISGGYGLFKEALQIVDKMYITEVDLNIEDGDTFFPEFDINDFEVLIGETLGEEVKYTRTFYVRKNELSRFWI